MRNRKGSYSRGSRRPLLLGLLTFAALSIPLGMIVAYTTSSATPFLQALQISGLCYAVGLAGLLFIESEHRWSDATDDQRPLEVIMALIGLGISIAFLIHFAHARMFANLRYGLLSAIVSVTFLIPRRTDKIRALAFALMAVATVQFPLVSSRPPFISLGVVCGAAAVACLLPMGERQTAIRRLPQTILCMFLTVMGLYRLHTAYQISSTSGLVIFGATALFFGVGTIVIVTRGDWFERHSRR